MNKNDVWKSTLKYFDGNSLAAQVWIDKYALQNDGEIFEESPFQMHGRLAKQFAKIEKKYERSLSYEEIFNLLDKFKYFIPGGSVMFGLGNPYVYTSIANCFCIGNNYDTYGGILRNDEELVQIMKRRGGVGIDISHLRPAGSKVNNAAKTSTGAISFASRYSNSTREVAQGGRRGALMLTMDVQHPDILDFVDLKKDLTKLTGANISVKITNKFLEAVEADEEFETSFYFIKDNKYVNPVIKKFPARKLWDKIISNTWESAEPGILFWDKILEESPADSYVGFETISVNPCAELPLCQYDSCRLGSINLYSFVDNPFTKQAVFNWKLFQEIVVKCQRLMDDLIDLEEERISAIIDKIDLDPEPPMLKFVEKSIWQRVIHKLLEGRRTGLGVLGLGDCLAALGLIYSTPEATKVAEDIMRDLAKYSYMSSILMATERGPFPRWHKDGDFNSGFTKRMQKELSTYYKTIWRKHGRRNIANLAVAPTGSLAILTQTTSGIEPLFQQSYKRRRKVDANEPDTNIVFIDENGDSWEEYDVHHPQLAVWAEKGVNMSNPYKGATANEIDVFEKIKMQGAIQKWIDHGISITHNLPKETTKEEVSDIYLKAWKYGCKGVTIYREGSRSGVLISDSSSKRQDGNAFPEVHSPKRPKTLKTDLFYPTVRGTQFVVLVGLFKDKPYEIFAFRQNGINLPKFFTEGYISKRKRGFYNLLDQDENIVVEDITSKFELPVEEFATRMVSTSLRHGVPVAFVVDQLDKAPAKTLYDYNKVIARVLKKYILDGDKVSGHTCSECGNNNLIYENGCVFCTQCGHSRC